MDPADETPSNPSLLLHGLKAKVVGTAPPAPEAPPPDREVLCGCGSFAKLVTCKNGANAGRQFYTCTMRSRRPDGSYGGGCTFFEWKDKLDATVAPPPAKVEVVPVTTVTQEAAEQVVDYQPDLTRLLEGAGYRVEATSPFLVVFQSVHLVAEPANPLERPLLLCLRKHAQLTVGGPAQDEFVWAMLHGPHEADRGWMHSPFVTHVVFPRRSARHDGLEYLLVPRQPLRALVEGYLRDLGPDGQTQTTDAALAHRHPLKVGSSHQVMLLVPVKLILEKLDVNLL